MLFKMDLGAEWTQLKGQDAYIDLQIWFKKMLNNWPLYRVSIMENHGI
jgi:hypothetical protein